MLKWTLLVALLSFAARKASSQQPVYWASNTPTFYSFAVIQPDTTIQVLSLFPVALCTSID